MTDESPDEPTTPKQETSGGGTDRRYRLLAYVAGETYSGQRKLTGDEVPTWPHLIVREFLGGLTVVILIWIVSIAFDAPLEQEANPSLTPNPAKAPWYFVGLQELLVYFDPWIAGVMIPLVIVFGLLAIPYLDANDRGRGEYAFSERKFAVTIFTFGVALWFVLIFIGMFLRGPNWAWYWPWEDWSVPKQTLAATQNLPPLWGGLLVVCYIVAGYVLPAVLLPKFRQQLGWMRYTITMFLLLSMVAVPVKIVLRLAFSIKYVVTTPWFNI